MVIMYNAAIGTDGHIDPCLLIILVPGLRHLNKGAGLPAAYAFCFPGDTDAAPANTYLYKIGACSGQEQEAFPAYHVSRTNFNCIPIFFPHPCKRFFLPAGISFRRIYAQHVCTCFQ